MTNITTVVLAADSRQIRDARTDLDNMGKAGTNASSTMMNLGKSLAGLAAAFLSVRTASNFVRNSISEFETLQRNLLRTDQLIITTGRQASMSAEGLHQQARAIAASTLQSTEGVMAAQQTLLTFRNITGDVFDRTIEGAVDLASAMRIDLNSAVLQLGKALEDPVRGMSALSRSGTVFTEQQREMVKELVETGRTLEAQNFILGELASQYGGVATNEAKGLAGAQDTLSQSVQELQQAFGARLVPSLTRATIALAGMADSVAAFISSDQFPVFMDTLVNLTMSLGAGLAVLATVHLVKFVASIKIASAAQAAFNLVALANPYVLLATGVAAVTFGLITYTQRQKEATAALQDYVRGTTILDPLKAVLQQRFEENELALQEERRATQAATQAIEEMSEAVSERIASLQEERRNLNLSERELFILNATTIKGTELTENHRQSIARAAAALFDEREEIKSTTEAQNKLNAARVAANEHVSNLVLANKRAEIQLVLTAREMAIYNAIMAHGTMLTGEQMIAIEASINSLFDMREEIQRNQEAVDFFTKFTVAAAKDRADAFAEEERERKELMRQTHEFMTRSLLDIFENGRSAFQKIGDAFSAMVKRMVAQWAASGLMRLFGMGGPAVANPFAQIAASPVGQAVGSIFGGGAAAAGTAGTAAAGGGIAGAAASVAGAAKTAGSTVMAAAAANPVLAAIAVAGLAAAALQTKSTPSTNAGLLIHDAPGVAADRKFAVSPFASGFAPVGFARREDQGAAQQVIEAFRAVDAQLTNAALSAGLNVDFSSNPFGGFDEKGQGNGLFLGAASEKGKGTTSSPIDQQLLMFSKQFVEALGSQVSSNDRATLLASSSVEELVAKANQIAGVEGSFRSGLDFVPFDGFRAELHRGERVLTASQSDDFNSLAGQFAELKSVMIQMLGSIMISTRDSADILERFDAVGLEVRA